MKFNLAENLKQHNPYDEAEKEYVAQTLAFLKQHKNKSFKRSNLAGHITASGVLFDADYSHVLLTEHKKLKRWLQLGGHSDGDKNSLHVAIKEAQEESGIAQVQPIFETIVDVDVQPIPYYAKKNVLPHWHYDMRFFLVTPQKEFVVSDESESLKWFGFAEFEKEFANDPSMMRLHTKWKQLLLDK